MLYLHIALSLLSKMWRDKNIFPIFFGHKNRYRLSNTMCFKYIFIENFFFFLYFFEFKTNVLQDCSTNKDRKIEGERKKTKTGHSQCVVLLNKDNNILNCAKVCFLLITINVISCGVNKLIACKYMSTYSIGDDKLLNQLRQFQLITTYRWLLWRTNCI